MSSPNTFLSRKKWLTTLLGVVVAVVAGRFATTDDSTNPPAGNPVASESRQSAGESRSASTTALRNPTSFASAAADDGSSRTTPRTTKKASTAGKTSNEQRTSAESKEGRSRASDATATPPAAGDGTSRQPDVRATDPDLVFGLLRRMGNDRYLSPEGILYTPGSAEGHRIEHLRRHVADQPGRPGSHGVFDGGLEKALAAIDLAYKKAKVGSRTTKKTDQGRTIYTVDMGKRIGFIGGRTGGQRRNPMARRIRLVLEGNRLITAYPM